MRYKGDGEKKKNELNNQMTHSCSVITICHADTGDTWVPLKTLHPFKKPRDLIIWVITLDVCSRIEQEFHGRWDHLGKALCGTHSGQCLPGNRRLG